MLMFKHKKILTAREDVSFNGDPVKILKIFSKNRCTMSMAAGGVDIYCNSAVWILRNFQ